MTAPSLALQLESQTDRSKLTGFAPGVREELLAAALAAAPGTEPIPLAGLLLGHHSDAETRITGWIPLGAFKSHEAMEAALRVELVRQKRAGVTCLGWFRSQPSGSSRASAEDLKLFSRAFPKRWQMTLVVRPAYRRPAQFSLYLRDAKGFVRPEAPTESFFLFPAAASRPKVHPLVTALAGFLDRRYSPWLALGMAVAGLMIGGLSAAQGVSAAAPAPLAIQQKNANWEISWDRTVGWSPSTQGWLIVTEAPGQQSVTRLSASDLRRGGVSVRSVNANAEPKVQLEIKQPDGQLKVETARLIQQLPEPKAATSRPARR